MTGLAAAAVWLQPVLITVVALRVAAGEADAPWLALGALVAPLVALLVPLRRAGANPVAALAAAVAITAALSANFFVAGDAATLLGLAPWQGVAAAAGLALAAGAWRDARRATAPALAAGLAVLLVALAGVAVAVGAPPWAAWSRGGTRSALTFSEHGEWTRGGERFARATRLAFTEGQRVTALSAGVYRVTERDAARPTVRAWRLSAGESLTLRPGDELDVEAGARLRFEAGRRVPGAPASGVAWADAPRREPRLLPLALAALVTLVGGALALVPSTGRGPAAAAGPVVLLAAIVTAIGWGVYAAAAAPELALGGALPAPIVRLPALVLGPRVGAPLAALGAAGLLVLLLAGTIALRQRLAAAAGPEPLLWAAMVVVAAGLTAWPLDPWRVLVLGLGVGAAAWTPTLIADGPGGGLAGSIVGGVVFVALSVLPGLAPGTPAWLDALTGYPALLAMPLGWAAARAVGEGTPPAV